MKSLNSALNAPTSESPKGGEHARHKRAKQTKGSAFGLLFQADPHAKDKKQPKKGQEEDAATAGLTAAALLQPQPQPQLLLRQLEAPNARAPQAQPREESNALASLHLTKGQEGVSMQLAQSQEAGPMARHKGTLKDSRQGEDSPRASVGQTLLPPSTAIRQEFPGGQEFSSAIRNIRQTLEQYQAKPSDDAAQQLKLHTFEGGGQLELELGNGAESARLRITVVDQRVELGFDGAPNEQVQRIRQTLIDSGFEVSTAALSHHQEQDAQHQDEAHQRARDAIAIKLRARGAQWHEEDGLKSSDDAALSPRGVRVNRVV